MLVLLQNSPLACRQGFSSMGGKCVRKVAKDADEVLEVVNSYLSIPVTSFTASRMEQVGNILHVYPLIDILVLG